MNKIPGETISESHALFLFLRMILDMCFEETVEIHNNNKDNILIQYMIDIWKQERGVTKKGSTENFVQKIKTMLRNDLCTVMHYNPM